MVRSVDSQWLDGATLESLLAKVTSQETLVVALTVKVVLPVVSDAGDAALVSVFVYSCPVTAVPPLLPQVPSV